MFPSSHIKFVADDKQLIKTQLWICEENPESWILNPPL